MSREREKEPRVDFWGIPIFKTTKRERSKDIKKVIFSQSQMREF